jgi:hypothetical protein
VIFTLFVFIDKPGVFLVVFIDAPFEFLSAAVAA